MYENMVFSAAFALYTAAILLYVWELASKRKVVGRFADYVTALGWAANTLALIMRYVSAGRLPLANGYEFLVAFAWGIVLFFLWVQYRYRFKSVGLFLLPVVWVLLAYIAVEMPSSQKMVSPLMPALKSNWLSVHVATAILSYGALALSFALAVMFLVKESCNQHNSRMAELCQSLPAMEVLDESCYRFITVGFFLLSLVIISGAIWAEQAWGAYWSWDPKETWSLITWLIYAACLHVRQTYGWRGRRSSVIAVIGFAAVLFTFFGVNYWLVGLHSYA
jgi:cytochrome c-type biogenesis protein CcsB